MLPDHSFNIWWRYIAKKELSANLYCNRKIGFTRVFSVCFLNDYVRGDQFGKVVHDESGKNFLAYVLHLFCVKMQQSNGVFQFPKCRFNTPGACRRATSVPLKENSQGLDLS